MLKSQTPASRTTRWFAVLAVVSGLFLLAGSWSPFQLRYDAWSTWPATWSAESLLSQRLSRSDVVANFWLGFPVALALCGAMQLHSGGLLRRFCGCAAVVVCQTLLGAVAELGQGWFENRFPSALDLAMQLAGCVTALVVWQLRGAWLQQQLDRLASSQTRAAERVDVVLGLVAVGILVWSVMPLDVVASPADFARQLLRAELFPFTKPLPTLSENVYQWLASTALAVPLGLWLTRYLSRNHGGRLSLLAICWLAIGVGVLPEVLQLGIHSRVGSATDALFGAVGALLGVLIGAGLKSTRFAPALVHLRSYPKRAETWFTLAAVLAAITCAVAWMPFDFSSQAGELRSRLESLYRNPFSRWGGSDLLTGLTLLRQIVLAGLLGVLIGCGQRCLSSRAKLAKRIVLTGIVVAGPAFFLLIELGQLLVDSRTGDLNGWLLRLIGFWLGVQLPTIVQGKPAAAGVEDSESRSHSQVTKGRSTRGVKTVGIDQG